MLTRQQSNNIKHNQRVIWYDLETTGFNPYWNQIIEIGACDNFGNTFQILIKPDKILKPNIIKITGITNSELDVKGVEQVDGLLEFYKFITMYDNISNNITCMIAHNNDGFDQLFIHNQFQLYGLTLPKLKYLDTLRMAQLTLDHLYSHSINSLCHFFNIINENEHRALSDSIALNKIYFPLLHLFNLKFISNKDNKNQDYIINKIKNPFI